MNKVWGIYEGSIHEGGGCSNVVYKNKEDAVKEAERVVAEQMHRDYKQWRTPARRAQFGGNPCDWKEKSEHYWSNGYDCISVQEFEVK